MKNYDAILFDLDGTLLETLPDILDAVNEALSILNINKKYSVENGKFLLGDGPIELGKRALGEFYKNNEDLQRFLDVYMPLYASHQEVKTKTFEGVKETLKILKKNGIKIVVATNKPQHLANRILNKIFGELYFDNIVGFENGKARKPSTEFINSVIEESQLKGLRLLYVGDSKPDLETAVNGKMDFCFVTWGYGFLSEDEKRKTKFIINKPCELLDVAGMVE